MSISNLRIKKLAMHDGEMVPMHRKVILVTVYHYSNIPPITSLEDMDSDDYLFLNDAIEDTMIKFNPDSQVFDVAIDEVKPSLYKSRRRARLFFKALRK